MYSELLTFGNSTLPSLIGLNHCQTSFCFVKSFALQRVFHTSIKVLIVFYLVLVAIEFTITKIKFYKLGWIVLKVVQAILKAPIFHIIED